MSTHDQMDEFQVPLHRKIAENLTQQVGNGKLKPGSKLPSERQIARQFEASRATVRTALGHLEQEGLISRRQRRSAVVTIRRDVQPSLRIACTHPRLMRLFERMAEVHILPNRSQIQLFDFQMEQVGQLAARAATSADILICDLEYVRCFEGWENYYATLPMSAVGDARIPDSIAGFCQSAEGYKTVPLSISPTMLYYDRTRVKPVDTEGHRLAPNWEQLTRMAQHLSGTGQYGLQLRPHFSHLAAFFASQGGHLYNKEGHIAGGEASFQQILKTLHEMLHTQRVIPLLAKAEQLNLFAQRRCAMAMDGFEMLNLYREKLGADLGLASLPQGSGPILSGFGVVVLQGKENSQMAQDIVRTLVSANSQRILTQSGSGLPVREDLLNLEELRSLGVSSDMGQVILQELQRARPVNLPRAADHKHMVENMFLELWLELDSFEHVADRFRHM